MEDYPVYSTLFPLSRYTTINLMMLTLLLTTQFLLYSNRSKLKNGSGSVGTESNPVKDRFRPRTLYVHTSMVSRVS